MYFNIQGWTIAVSSDFIPHMVYKFVASDNGTLDNYLEHTLSGKNDR